MAELAVLDGAGVFAAVTAAAAIDAVQEAFVRHRRGEWRMPSKTYLPSPPYGDFRAMPAHGGDVAILKWISSFPGNPQRAEPLPTVSGLVCVSDAETAVPLALLDAAAVTALRTGASAAVASRALAAEGARTVGLIGCGVNGAWAARCLAEAGFGPGVCVDARPEAADALATELEGWRPGTKEEALSADVVCCVTPGAEELVTRATLRPGQHLNMLGADGPGKREAEPEAVAECALFCDEWAQASHGGELTPAVEAGLVTRDQVTEIGGVLTGELTGRPSAEAVTLFDSTGLAIQDLAIARAAWAAIRAGSAEPQRVTI